MTDKSLLVNVEQWIEENKHAFNPPVCNKLMHFRQLNIMFVGGPNTRKDYHIEEGEELFFQVKGDMCLKVVENGKHKDVHIKEGEMFLLPARIPHSPQRQADTVGLVVERRRLQSETDCLRYYVDGSTELLFERWFHCEDLGTQLVPVITEFMKSKQAQTGRPDPGDVFREPPFQMNSLNVMSPFCFKSWLVKHRAALSGGGGANLSGGGGANLSGGGGANLSGGGGANLSGGGGVDLFGAQFETEALVFGAGLSADTRQSDAWIWQLEGGSTVTVGNEELQLKPGDSVLIPERNQFSWSRDEATVALFVSQNPERKRP